MLKRFGGWLLEDTGKKSSERDKAVAAAEAESEAARQALVTDALARVAPPNAAPLAAAARQGWRQRVIGVLAVKKRPEEPARAEPALPEADTDWRWKVRRAFKSQVRGIVYARTLIILLLVVSGAWTSVQASTGFDLLDLMRPIDPEDERSRFKTPFFVVESGSMMHKHAPYGRVGTVDPGDVVVIEKLGPGDRIETFYGSGERQAAGAKGDVIMFLPINRGDAPVDPIIHRAVALILREEIPIPNPNPSPTAPAYISAPRFTVTEFGIFSARAVNIPELGLYNYQPENGGYITRGDNQRSNNWADQALGVTPDPVPLDRIIGRLKWEVPVIGLAKLAFTGQDPAQLSPDEAWCAFLMGKAACDTWVAFFALVIVFVVLPLGVTFVVFGRRLYVRYLDRVATRRRSEAAVANAETEDGIRMFDSEDLLTGRVRVRTDPKATGKATWDELMQPGSIEWQDGPA